MFLSNNIFVIDKQKSFFDFRYRLIDIGRLHFEWAMRRSLWARVSTNQQ